MEWETGGTAMFTPAILVGPNLVGAASRYNRVALGWIEVRWNPCIVPINIVIVQANDGSSVTLKKPSSEQKWVLI